MSRTRIVKGSVTKITGGNHNICSRESSVNFIAGGKVTFKGEKEGILYTNNPVFPEELFINNIVNCVVYFRQMDTWNGEFGMDWLREKDNGLAPSTAPAYEDIIVSGYKDGRTDLTPTEAYEKLKNEYTKIPITRSPLEDGAPVPAIPPPTMYFVPYLTLFSKTFVDTLPETIINKPKYEAELKILVELEDDIDKLEFDLSTINRDADNPLITIDKVTLEHKTKTEGIVLATDATIKITCQKDLDSDKTINIYSYPKDSTTRTLAEQLAERKLAGQIKILKNNAEARKNIKFVLAPVNTNILGIEKTGQFSPSEQKSLQQGLYQSIVTNELEIGPLLDLSADEKFKLTTDERGNRTYGEFIYRNTDNNIQRTDGNINEDHPNIFTHVKQLYLSQNPQYQNYYTMFSFNENTYDSFHDPTTGRAAAVPGQVQAISIKNVFLFNGVLGAQRDDKTIAHEGLHGLGLNHTHNDGTPITEISRKFTFANGNVNLLNSTDNIMSYGQGNKISTWKWQWDIVRSNI